MMAHSPEWIYRIIIAAIIIVNGLLQDGDLHRIDTILKTLHPR